MAKIRLVVLMGALVAATACTHQQTTVDTLFPEPTVVSGPPGGEMDPAWQPGGGGGAQYADPAGSPDGYAPDGGDPSGTYAVTGDLEASADPSAPGYVMGEVTDGEIDQTLDGYGEWVENEDYGRVWRPYATVVGVDFTPYETCGSWVWTNDWGWVYGCDWDWGWLPFHYGRWGWIDDSWAWVPDHQWGAAWVDWRGGGGYVGWRPSAPVVRDHRGQHQGPEFHDHRSHAKQMESHWRFATVGDFGKHNIRAHLFKNPAEGLRVTSIATRPPLRGSVQPVRAASVMRGRLASLGLANNTNWRGSRNPRGAINASAPLDSRGNRGGQINADAPTWRPRASSSFGGNDSPSVWAPGAKVSGGTTGGLPGGSQGGGPGSFGPSIEPGDRSVGTSTGGGDFGGSRPLPPHHPSSNDASSLPGGSPESFGDPSLPEPASHPHWGGADNVSPISPTQGGGTVSPVAPTQWGGGGTVSPVAPTQAQPSWGAPTQPTWHPRNGGSYTPSSPVNPPIAPSQPYNPPQRTWNPPASTYNPPVRTYNPPQRTWNPPASTYNPPVRTYNPPPRSFSSPSHSSWSPPASSSPSHSSWSAPSHSSSSSFSPSHSSGGSFGGGHSSGGFGGGGGHSGGHHR